jgi:hypothetical protein
MKQKNGETVRPSTALDHSVGQRHRALRVHTFEGNPENDVVVRDAIKALKSGKIIILSGSPGAGKTFWSRIIGEPLWNELQSSDQFLPCYVDYDRHYKDETKRVSRAQWTNENWNRINSQVVHQVDLLLRPSKRRRKTQNAVIIELPATDTEVIRNGESIIEDRGLGAFEALVQKYPTFAIHLVPTPTLQEFSSLAKNEARIAQTPEEFAHVLIAAGIELAGESYSRRSYRKHLERMKELMANSARPQAVLDVFSEFLAMIDSKLKGVKKEDLQRIDIPETLKKFGKEFIENVQKIVFFLTQRFKKNGMVSTNSRIVINDRVPHLVQYI